MCVYMYMQRVRRPRGGINEWLHWLPVSLQKKLDLFFSRIQIPVKQKKVFPISADENGTNFIAIFTQFFSGFMLEFWRINDWIGYRAGLSDILEADAKRIANMARETFDK